MSKWARIIAITGYVSITFIVAMAMITAIVAPLLLAWEDLGGGGYLIFAVVVSSLLFLFPLFYLTKFANKTFLGIKHMNTEEVVSGLENLKSYFKFMALLFILFITFLVGLFFYGLVMLVLQTG